jgi:hypothetical protein
LLLTLGACGDGDSGTTTTTSPTPTPTPTTPSAADISVDILSFGAAGSSMGNAFEIGLRMTESAGLGANINFVRLEVFTALGAFEERQEIGSGSIIAQTGSNRLEGNATRTLNALFGFNATIKSGRIIQVTIGFTDDRGNSTNFVGSFVFN